MRLVFILFFLQTLFVFQQILLPALRNRVSQSIFYSFRRLTFAHSSFVILLDTNYSHEHHSKHQKISPT